VRLVAFWLTVAAALASVACQAGPSGASRPSTADCAAARAEYDPAANTLYNRERHESIYASEARAELARVRKTLAACISPSPNADQCLEAMDDYGGAYYELALVDSDVLRSNGRTTPETDEANARVRTKLTQARDVLFACVLKP
jgi:hypothetical protein